MGDLPRDSINSQRSGNPLLPSSARWWRDARWKYNIGLIIAGALTFFCYAAVLSLLHRNGQLLDVRITISSIILGSGYLVMMYVANHLYDLGYLLEIIYRPNQPAKFRQIVFSLGFWFSTLFPFAVLAFLIFLITAKC